ncbi:MAG TPA: reverse transcriptase family protein [Chitinophagaceae bacterium]
MVQPLVFLIWLIMINKPKHLYYVLHSSKEELEEITKNIDRYYYHFKKAKRKYGNKQEENGIIRYRDLYPSRGRLKEIQQRINILLQRVKLPEYAYGSVKGRNNIHNALMHIRNKHFLAVDLKNFFPNITYHQVFRMFRYYNFSPDASHILTKLTTYKGSLPQGAPTSPIIANLVFTQTGLLLSKIAANNNITFTAFLDDLEFSSKTDFKHLIQEILQEIKSGGFYLHHKKISYREKKPEVTGLLITDKGLTVNSIIRKRAKINPFTMHYLKRVEVAAEE